MINSIIVYVARGVVHRTITTGTGTGTPIYINANGR